MYFPYLRGRQFELIALREFALQRGDKNNVFPIIEPVKTSYNSLKTAVEKFKESDLHFSIVLNPLVGDLTNVKDIYNKIEEFVRGTNFIPAFFIQNNIKEIAKIIESFDKVLLIISSIADSTSDEFFDLILDDSVEYILSTENKSLRRKLQKKNKNLIILNDCFIKKDRNKDYLDTPAERFTEEHTFYEDESYYGFSDFTTVPSDFKEGGTTPYAVAIHLTYQKNEDEIWIRHFTSESNEDQANVQGKFAEAAKKAVGFLDEENIKTHAAQELREYFHAQKYPGLGVVKKISIKNHIELINSIL